MEEVQHNRAVLPSIERHIHFLEAVLLVGLLKSGEGVADLGDQRGREEGGHTWGESGQEPLNLTPGEREREVRGGAHGPESELHRTHTKESWLSVVGVCLPCIYFGSGDCGVLWCSDDDIKTSVSRRVRE